MPFKYLLAITAAFSAIPASAGYEGARPRYTFAELRMFHLETLKHLRADLLKQVQADGGALSPASRDRFQAKLDKINRAYRIALRNNDPSSVDSMGAPLERTYGL